MEKGETVVVNTSIEAPKCPWGQSQNSTKAPCSLSTVMDEEIAQELQKKENMLAGYAVEEALSPIDFTVGGSDGDTDSDFMLAQMLQQQFDQEHDTMISAYEKKYNGDSKVSVSFDNYRTVHPSLHESSSSSEDEDLLEEDFNVQAWPTKSQGTAFGQSPGKKEITTKHDPVICGRRNVKNLDKLPGLAAGNMRGKDMDVTLSNSVYNTLKQHSYQEERRSHRVHEKKEHSTHEQALDPKTRLLMYRLVNAEVLESISGAVSTGKEACVFHAKGGRCVKPDARKDDTPLPDECAVKVFKTTLNEFKTRERYIKDDHRFKDRFSKQNPRKIIKLWAEKEMCNLSRMQKAGISCPRPVVLKKHVLVMSFIGRDQKPAPKLKEATLSCSQMGTAYEQCVQMMCTMYAKCNLIHADLSEYNMLWHDGRVWFIDVSQSVEPFHPKALEFLYRDCNNVVEFFKKQGVRNVMSAQQLFRKVSQLDIPECEESKFLSQIQLYESYEMTLGGRKNDQAYQFDYFFEKTTRNQEEGSQEGPV